MSNLKNRIKLICALIMLESPIHILIGFYKKKQNLILQQKYGFDKWHLSPVEHRPYSLWAVKKIKQICHAEQLSSVVDVGCGLGNIISKIPAPKRYGFDISKEVIEAAKEKHFSSDIWFEAGSFDDISGMNIDMLIALNFTHTIEPVALKKYFNDICGKNTIKYIVVDSHPLGEFFHNYSDILSGRGGGGYCLLNESPPQHTSHGSYIQIWQMK